MPNFLPAFILTVLWCGSFTLSLLPFVLLNSDSPLVRLASIAVAPFIFILAFPTLAGLLSLPAQKGIVKGKFPRDSKHPVYLLRRIYGTAWTQVYYFKPLYAAILAIPLLKKYVLRLFGYRGSTDFVVYPDTWIRDLPILQIGQGAYLSNRATIGTNICLTDGTIFVAGIKIKEKGLIGHLAMLAPGVSVDEAGEVGVGCAIGISVKIRAGASVKPSCTLNHGAIIGAKAEVGTMSYIGLRAEIGEGVSLPAGSNIPAGAVLKTQGDVDKYYSSETEKLQQMRAAVLPFVQNQLKNE